MTSEQLRSIRTKLFKLSQAKLAKRLGIGTQQISRQERGQTGVPEPQARAIVMLYVLVRRKYGETVSAIRGPRLERRAVRELRNILGDEALEWYEDYVTPGRR